MKRYASHFLFIEGHGLLKQHVVEVEDGVVIRIFPLVEEVENTEWLPGILAIFPSKGVVDLKEEILHVKILTLPQGLSEKLSLFTLYSFYPFDLTAMQPVSETRHKLLR